MLNTLAISGYRSLRNVVVPLRALNVITGPTGAGKTGIYRALHLLADGAHGRLAASLAAEGGLAATAWAGPEARLAVPRYDHPIEGVRPQDGGHLRLGIAADDFGYAIDLGPAVSGADPGIEAEALWRGPCYQPASVLAEQHAAAASASLLAPRDQPLGAFVRAWRFPLAADFPGLPAALQSIRAVASSALDDAVRDAFPESRVTVENGALQFHHHGLRRPLDSRELSSGTLQYLQWMAELLAPERPPLIALHEPAARLHPDLLPAFARLIASAAARSQLVVVSHSPQLIAALEHKPECHLIELEKNFGETVIDNLEEEPAWRWPSR